MTWYKSPIRPMDPVVESQQPKPPIRYVRDNFTGTGQNSHDLPPAQDQSMWQSVVNIMPITKGVLERRWGWTTLATPFGVADSANRLYQFQSDAIGSRYLIDCQSTSVKVFDEAGNLVNNNLYSPLTGAVIRSLTSRNYQYFCDGNALESYKWDGINFVTQWGIDATNVTANNTGGGTTGNTYGPNRATSITDRGGPVGWTNQSTLSGPSATAASAGMTLTNTVTNTLTLDSMGFSVPGGNITGISVNVAGSVTGLCGGYTVVVQLDKGGNAYTAAKTFIHNGGPSGFNNTFGSSTDLWGGTWTISDINSAGFGVNVHLTSSANVSHGTAAQSANAHLTNIQVTIYTTTSGSSGTSGSGVGITSIVGSGNVTLAVGRIYYLTFYNSNSGHFSDLTTASVSTGPTSSAKINLILATNNDTQVTHKYLLATADGNDPSVLYLVAELPNSTTTYTDNTPDTTLITQQTLLFTDQFGNEYGVTNNLPPPAATIVCKHKSRMWLAGVPGASHSVFFSKGISELTLPNGYIAGKYEEAFPGSNYFDVSDAAESVVGLLSDGQSLYIGTQNHIRRLTGDDPASFGQPEIVHPNVGLMNQEVWQLVFNQGSPAGAVWMTPDFRVIQSDFNTYVDIGSPIQDILNSLQGTAVSTLSHASFFADGEYEVYMLQVPFQSSTYCDLNLLFDLRTRQWFVWTFTSPSQGSFASLFNITAVGVPQWLFVDNFGNILQWNPNAVNDGGAGSISWSATTSWLHLGEPTRRKLLNEVQISGDPNMTVSVLGANNQTDFVGSTANGIVSATSNSSGIGYTVGDILTVVQSGASGGTIQITAIVAGVNQYSVITPGTGYTTAPLLSTTGGTGTGALVNIVAQPPTTIVANGTLRQSPFGSWNLYTVNAPAHHKYYQFIFSGSTSGVQPIVLGGYSIHSTPLDDL